MPGPTPPPAEPRAEGPGARRPPRPRRAARAAAVLAGLVAAVLLDGCAGRRPPPPPGPGYEERGVASWYGPGFHGRATASGEIYDMHAMTAAHRTLPFGSLVEVDNLDNGRRTRVRINDRGPFVRGRIIDLSRTAAQEIGMIGPGTARVRIRVVGVAAAPVVAAAGGAGPFVVQAGAFRERSRAHDLARRLRRSYAGVEVASGADGWHRVLLGPFGDRDRAEGLARRLERSGLEAVVRGPV